MGRFDVYSFHEDYYRKAMKTIEETAGKKYAAFLDEHGEQEPVSERVGWLDWFERMHPELYSKYADAIDRIVKLWGNMAPQAIDDFKAAVKIEVEATQWAVDRYVEHHMKLQEEDRLKGRQEALNI
jgi:hypothetical protein